jgi:hypothetical protein
MRFKVPQFIEVEDKIFGPLTFKQFVYLVGGGGFCFVLYQVLPFIVAVLFIIPIGALSLALAFYKVNNRSFINMLEAFFGYILSKRFYIWKKQQTVPEKKEPVEVLNKSFVPKLSESKLEDIAWSLDIKKNL